MALCAPRIRTGLGVIWRTALVIGVATATDFRGWVVAHDVDGERVKGLIELFAVFVQAARLEKLGAIKTLIIVFRDHRENPSGGLFLFDVLNARNQFRGVDEVLRAHGLRYCKGWKSQGFCWVFFFNKQENYFIRRQKILWPLQLCGCQSPPFQPPLTSAT